MIRIFLILLIIFTNNLNAKNMVCYAKEDYFSLDAFFGHVFFANDNKTFSFNINSDFSINTGLKSLIYVDAIYEVHNKDKLIDYYENRLKRKVTCYELNISNEDDEKLNNIYLQNDEYSSYSFLYNNCSSALYKKALAYDVVLYNSILPIHFIKLNTNENIYLHNFAIFYDKNKVDLKASLLMLSNKFSHSFEILNIGRFKTLLFGISHFENISYEINSSIIYKEKKWKNDFFIGYFYKFIFLGFANYGLEGGFLYDFSNYGVKLNLNKKGFSFKSYYDYKHLRAFLQANKKSAKIGLIFNF